MNSKGCPSIMMADRGTETILVGTCQMAMRHACDDTFSGEKSFRYGSSTTNTVSCNLIIILLNNINSVIILLSELKVGGHSCENQ